MANQEHLDILKQGVEVWNKWRKEHPDILPDLRRVNLRGIVLNEIDLHRAKLQGANFTLVELSQADLGKADLIQAVLSGINFNRANLSRANLNKANLSKADLNGANLIETNLSQADLSRTRFAGADLSGADLFGADLSGANLFGADLSGANLNLAILNEADLSWADVAFTVFGNVDLSIVKGLDLIKHQGPSTIGIDTLIRSQGKIPEIFLRNAGVPDSIIEMIPSLVASLKPIDFYSCFISYSSKDQDFAERLYNDLQGKGVRCWFAPEDLDIGDKIRHRIDESIRLYDKLLLVLSEYSIASNWVAYEVEQVLNKEPEGIPNVLYPIRLDNTVMQSKARWADDIRRTRHIGDFTHWTNHDDYQKAFSRLLRALKAEAQKGLKMESRDSTTNGG